MNPDGHFDIDAWVDFVRGLCTTAQNKTMQEHLAACKTCSEMAQFLGKVWRVGRNMGEETVPLAWSIKAEQILGDQTLMPLRRLAAYAAVLTFDSFAALAPNHVRAGPSSSRRLSYSALDCSLELMVDQNPEQHAVWIVGQITDRRTPDQPIPSTPVFLLTGNKVLASTSSNEFGEFQIACKPKRKLSISFPFAGSRIDVFLDRLFQQESGRHDV
jgi:hypothetical protein